MYDTLILPNDGKSIRLLAILPAFDPHAQIDTSLWVSELSGSEGYEALSYCWNTAQGYTTILVNGISTQVSETLAGALRRLRLVNKTRVVWIDAVCINQNDTSEKNFQVSLMRNIYANCTKVVIWLGESDDHSRKAFRSMHKDASHQSRDIFELFRRPWFKRVWVVQELAYAPRALVTCGADEIWWQQLSQAASSQNWDRIYVEIVQEPEGIHHIFYPQIMEKARERIVASNKYTLLDALRIFRPFDATLSVDKVYAIIGLLMEPDAITIDYNRSIREVYSLVALTIIRHTGTLDLLSDCLQWQPAAELESLPSWVPNWADRRSSFNPTLIQDSQFSATSASVCKDPFVDSETIQLSGHIVATIAEMGTSFPSVAELREQYWPVGRLLPYRKSLDLLIHGPSLIRDWQNVARRVNSDSASLQDKYATNETVSEVFRHVLNYRSPPSDLQAASIWSFEDELFEFMMTAMEFFGHHIVARLPYAIGWLLAGPYFAFLSVYFVSTNLKKIQTLTPFRTDSGPKAQKDQGYSSVLGRTDTGLIGMFPGLGLAAAADMLTTETGDVVVLFRGAATPFVVRREGEHWRLVGEANIYGIMQGGAFEEEKCVTISIA